MNKLAGLLTVLLSIQVLAQRSAHDSGRGGVNGGGAFSYRDSVTGKIKLADSLVVDIEADPILNQALTEELVIVGRILNSYGMRNANVQVRPHNTSVETEMWQDLIFNSKFQYFLLEDEMFSKKIKQYGGECLYFPTIKTNQDLDPIACTVGPDTFINKNLWEDLESVSQKALVIVHERLRSFGLSLERIAPITRAAEFALSLFHEQKNGSRPVLSDLQIDTLKRMQDSIWRSGLGGSRRPDSFSSIYRNGGGVVLRNCNNRGNCQPDAKIASNVYVGIGSVIGRRLEIKNGTEILNSNVCQNNWTNDMCHIGENVKIYNTFVPAVSLQIEDSVELKDSILGSPYCYN
ncbi:MAG: hypothetical protein ABL927_13660, partial [Bdellovibrionales bacterium]